MCWRAVLRWAVLLVLCWDCLGEQWGGPFAAPPRVLNLFPWGKRLVGALYRACLPSPKGGFALKANWTFGFFF